MTGFSGWVGGQQLNNAEDPALYLLGSITLDAKPLAPEEILKLYLNQGAQCLSTFKGHFALCIVQANHHEVFLASDRFSTYPIYYASVEDHFFFASHLSALLQRHAIKPELNPQSIYDYLYFHFIPTPHTIYKNIHRLEAGHTLIHRQKRTISMPYWQPEAFSEKKVSYMHSKTALDLHLKNALEKIQQPRLGAFLSGGLDSSTLVGLLAKRDPSNTHAFTIGFDEKKYDESEYAVTVAKHFGVQHSQLILGPSDLLQTIPKVVRELDQPFGNASIMGAYFCAQLAKSKGIQCMVAGDGGDELFGGNSRYLSHLRLQQYRNSPAWAQRALDFCINKLPKNQPFTFIKKLQKLVSYSHLTAPQRDQVHNLLAQIQAARLFDSDFFENISAKNTTNQHQQSYGSAQSTSWLGKLLCMDSKWILADNDVFKVRAACNMNQIEVNFPFLDDDLVNFALKLPDAYKVQPNRLRPFYKKAMQGFLPESILKKKKHGFGIPFGVWLNQDEALRAFTYETLNQLKKRHIIQADFIDDLKNNLIFSHPGYYGVMAWILLILELWLQTHTITGASPLFFNSANH